jgi:hypothetical protein
MLAKLKPGDKLAMRWLMLWREPDAYRDDRSVWAKLVKDFAFADDPDTELAGAARTSGPNSEDRWHKVPPECAAVLHYQFVPWWRTQAKQAWYRCFALIREPQEAYRINAMYRATLDTRAAHTTAVPPGWLEGIAVPAGIQDLPGAWHLGAILEWFDEYGIEFFEPLQIWHVPELRDAFLETVGRRPRPTLHLPPRQRAASILASAAAAVKRGHD